MQRFRRPGKPLWIHNSSRLYFLHLLVETWSSSWLVFSKFISVCWRAEMAQAGHGRQACVMLYSTSAKCWYLQCWFLSIPQIAVVICTISCCCLSPKALPAQPLLGTPQNSSNGQTTQSTTYLGPWFQLGQWLVVQPPNWRKSDVFSGPSMSDTDPTIVQQEWNIQTIPVHIYLGYLVCIYININIYYMLYIGYVIFYKLLKIRYFILYI